jgi:CheY-like chemotaxis protein
MRILIVEDQPAAVRPLVLLLGARGYAVEVARSCGAALAILDAEGADSFFAILTDLNLPDGSGEQVAAAAAGHPCVVAVTGLPLEDDALEAGPFTHHLRKPLEFDALLAILADQGS